MHSGFSLNACAQIGECRIVAWHPPPIATISSLIENISLSPNGKRLYRPDTLATPPMDVPRPTDFCAPWALSYPGFPKSVSLARHVWRILEVSEELLDCQTKCPAGVKWHICGSFLSVKSPRKTWNVWWMTQALSDKTSSKLEKVFGKPAFLCVKVHVCLSYRVSQVLHCVFMLFDKIIKLM